MHPHPLPHVFSTVVLFGLAGLAGLAGCTTLSSGPNADARNAASAGATDGIAPSWSSPTVAPVQATDPAPGGMIDPIAQVQTQLASPSRPVITAVVEWGEPDTTQSAAAQPDAQVFEATVRSADQRIDASQPQAGSEANQAATPAHGADTPTDVNALADAQTDVAPTPLYAGVETLTRAELVDELHRRLSELNAPPMRRALASTGLSLVRPGLGVDPLVLDALDPTQATLIERFGKLTHELARRIEANDLAELDATVLAQALEAMQGPSPLTLRNAQLCRRVSGFGVYEPFATHEFIAGRDHRVIVYAEVDHFQTAPNPNGPGFQVKLEQELTLFNEADGLAVWKQPAQPIQDTSRRQRRDFWNVQMITLPANLGVGKYRLKLRVTDLHGGTVDEATLPITLLADASAREQGTANDLLNNNATDLTDTQRDLLRSLAPGLFNDAN